uniref:G-protein coupled receptors family 3 profile domain-containing protein n=1 Tax=Xenopus tropicalis TaxID=8364 RepID=A0A1B8Y6U7_XENTR
MLGPTAVCSSVKVLIYLAILCVGPYRSGVHPLNPACHLQIIKAVKEYEYMKEGDIMIGGVMTSHFHMKNVTFPWSKSTRLLCVSFVQLQLASCSLLPPSSLTAASKLTAQTNVNHKGSLFTFLSPYPHLWRVTMATYSMTLARLMTYLDGGSPNQQGYRYLVDFRYAVEQTNKDPARLPNLTLGYHIYDSCGDPRKAVRSILQILSGTREPVPNYSCVGKRNIAGFIGDLTSETTVPIAQILTLYGYSQISYGATDPLLSDRVTFPYFFRTVQSDEANYFALGKLLSHFGWTWVGIITSDDISGEREHHSLAKYLSREGVCIEFTIKINTNKEHTMKPNQYGIIIQGSSTGVIIISGTASTTFVIQLPILNNVLQEKTLILSSNWGNNNIVVGYAVDIFNYSLVFVPRYHYDLGTPEMSRFLEDLHPSKFPEDELIEDIFLMFHSCLSKDKNKNELYKYIYGNTLCNCTGQERITELYYFIGTNSPRVHLAVDIMSQALHEMLFIKDFIQYPYKYQIPRAQCSDNCLPGFRKAPKPGAQSCCYDCVPCSEGEISNTTDSESCIRCPDVEWPNEEKSQCIAKMEEFLSYSDDVISVICLFISVLFFLITEVILGVFIKYQDTPIVRANNRSLSFLLLVSIKLSFLSVFLFLGRPVDITCMLRIITFGITFSIAVSSLLAKTIMVCVAFKATKPGSSWRKWLGVKLSNSVVLFCSSIQIIICMTWLAISPPFQELDIHTSPGTIIIQCNEGSAIGFYSVIGYMGLLAAVSFVLAFLARSLPDSFNEAKYITFSMLLFCSVWITMIPAYLSTKGKNTVCVEIFAILTSSAGLLASIFLPKCYTILLRPELNIKTSLLRN